MTTTVHRSPFRPGRRVRVRWPTKAPDGKVYTGGVVVALLPGTVPTIVVNLETRDGAHRRRGEFRGEQLIVATEHWEG